MALQLRLLLSRGTSLAIATVVDARGAVVRQPGTVLVVTEAGQTIGFNPAGPLDGAIRELAAETLATRQDRLKRLHIEEDAAAYIGLSGQISLDVHAMRMDAADPAYGAMLRYFDSDVAPHERVAAAKGAPMRNPLVVSADHARPTESPCPSPPP